MIEFAVFDFLGCTPTIVRSSQHLCQQENQVLDFKIFQKLSEIIKIGLFVMVNLIEFSNIKRLLLLHVVFKEEIRYNN